MPAETVTTPRAVTVPQAVQQIESLLSIPEHGRSKPAPQPTPAVTQPAPDADDDLDALLDLDENPDSPDSEREQPDPDAERSEQDEDPEPAPAPTPTRRVKIGDQEIEVTDDELVKGYSRQADYTRKTQALAERAKTYDAELAATQQERDQTSKLLRHLEAVLAEDLPQEVDWDKLRQEQPEEFANKYAEVQIAKQRIRAVREKREQLELQTQREQVTSLQAHLVTQRDQLKVVLPDLFDSAKGPTLRKELLEHAVAKYGFSEQEFNNVVDHRGVVLLHKAMQYDRLLERRDAARKKISEEPAVTPGPGGQRKPKPADPITRSKERFGKEPTARNAADTIEKLLVAEERNARRR